MAETRSFENSLAELEARVARLERGDLDLDDALRLFEEGVSLVRECHEKLDSAEARIIALSGSPGDVRETESRPKEDRF
jgi:exodeoxyribonuclease VII small subunit